MQISIKTIEFINIPPVDEIKLTIVCEDLGFLTNGSESNQFEQWRQILDDRDRERPSFQVNNIVSMFFIASQLRLRWHKTYSTLCR